MSMLTQDFVPLLFTFVAGWLIFMGLNRSLRPSIAGAKQSLPNAKKFTFDQDNDADNEAETEYETSEDDNESFGADTEDGADAAAAAVAARGLLDRLRPPPPLF